MQIETRQAQPARLKLAEQREGHPPPHPYAGSHFAVVWNAVAADPYPVLPKERVSWRSIPSFVRDAALLRAAQRTLDSRADLLPGFRKLVHPYGICLKGSWEISEATSYTGYFATGKKGLLIARASDAMNETRPGKLRFLGLAGKLYPTLDPDHKEPLETANFFVMENLGGSHRERFSEATMGNDLLPLRPHPGTLGYAPLVNVVGPAFVLAGRALAPTQAMIRQLYPIAELGEASPAQAYGPRFMRLVGMQQGHAPATSDLREELDMQFYPRGLRFDIQVADGHRLLPKAWRTIGVVRFSESVASLSGDTRLHFAHPRYVKGRAERA